MGAIASQIAREAKYTLNDDATAEAAEVLDTTRRPDDALGTLLESWTRAARARLVLLIDEIDALVGDTLVSVLRQLRAGYVHRPAGFPQSVVLCGVRDVRDYRIQAGSEKEVITGGSAFNIKARSLQDGGFQPRPGRGSSAAAHRRDWPGVRARGGSGRLGADPRTAVARQRAGTRDVLFGGWVPRESGKISLPA